jgi:hypothetical protein
MEENYAHRWIGKEPTNRSQRTSYPQHFETIADRLDSI